MEMTLNKDYFSVCANDLIKAQQKLNLREMQLLQIAISQIKKDDSELLEYTTTASELAKFLNTDIHNIYKDYKKITDNLMKSIVYVMIDGKERKFQWVSNCDYDTKTKEIVIQLHDKLKPFLIGLNKLYTQIELSTLIKFKSYYSIRLYQLIVCEYGARKKTDFELTIDEIRKFFGIDEEQYKLTADLLRYTLKMAINEINTLDEVSIKQYEEIKSGRKIKLVKFKAVWL